MFYQIKNGTQITVGENFKCWLPPPPEDKSQIINYGLPKEEQYWKREPIPKWYLERSLEEEFKQKDDLKLILAGKKKTMFVDPMCERYRRREWHRRIYGVHIMINGECIYLTNHHYYYLQWCKFDHKENNGYPFYYEFSRTNFYIRQWSEENPWSMGYMFIGPRATGKSNEELACIANRSTYLHNHRAALQSKHFEMDAKGVLIQAKMVPLFNALPKFFKPEYAHGTNTMESLVFNRKSVSGEKTKGVEFGPDHELLSTIFAAPPGEKALDTETLSDLFEDEIGKCILPETLVITSTGKIKEAKDVSIGEKLLGSDSTPRKIIQITTGIDKAFKIIPNKSGWDEWGCVSGHKLALKWCWKDRPLKFNNKIYQKDDTVIMTIDSFMRLNKTHQKHLMLFKVPVNYQPKQVLIDPYLMGVWLGDGDSKQMTITAIENEIIDSLYEFGKVTARPLNNRSPRFHLEGFHHLLKFYNVKNNKHIPIDYLINGRNDRLKLLAGIIDTDGHVLVDGNRLNCEITQKNKRLALDIKRLSTELGFSCSFEPKIATMNREDGSVYKCEVYRMFLFGDLWEIPTRVKRKQFPQIKDHHKNRRNPLRSGFKIQPIGDSEYIGFVLDGDKLHLLGDCQVTHNTKPKEVADIYVRHEVNLKCVFRNNRKIGLLRKTSTVEEMNEGGDECHRLWKDSDMKVIDGNGFTTSKIHRHLISALDTDTSLVPYTDSTGKNYGAPCNKYGSIDRHIANIKIQNDFDAVKHDLKKLSGRMRKSPRNETEAFIKDQSKSIFNVMLLSNRLEHIRNHMPKPPYVRGNLFWLKDKFGPVWWERDDHAGRFNWAWFPDEFSQIKEPDKAKILNNVGQEWGYDRQGNARMMMFPKNDHLFRIGGDPIKYTRTKDPRASKAATHGFRLYDEFVDGGRKAFPDKWDSHNFIFEYRNRPEDPETSYEDMAMACIFLGCKSMPERNITDLNRYFENNGLEKFLFYPQDASEIGLDVQGRSDDAGLASTPEVINYYTTRIIQFINRHINRMPFDNTIEDWLDFDPTNPTKSDLTVSSGFTLIHAEKVGKYEEPPSEKISDWFESYDNSGKNGIFTTLDN